VAAGGSTKLVTIATQTTTDHCSAVSRPESYSPSAELSAISAAAAATESLYNDPGAGSLSPAFYHVNWPLTDSGTTPPPPR